VDSSSVSPRRALAAAALCACLFPAPCWSGEGFAEGESRPSSTEATCRDFETTLAKLTPLSPEETLKLRLLFNSSPTEQRLALDALLQKVGTPSPEAVAQLRLALLSPDASVRWTSIQILARGSDAPVLLFARLLRDDSREVQNAAEQALVAAGHPAISPLAQVVAAEPCYSRAKAAATRALGALGDPCGREPVAEALIKNQGGCYDHELAFKALRQMGEPAIETLVDLLQYRMLKGGAYLALLEYSPAALKSELLPMIGDPDLEIDDRFQVATHAEILLGTMAIFRELDAFYLGVVADTSLPPEIVETARRVWIDRPPRPFVIEALTRERVESDYAAGRFIAEDEALAGMARAKRRNEIGAAKYAQAEADKKSRQSTPGGFANGASPIATGVRSLPARLKTPRGGG
jgi:hypothetical protein